MSKLNVAVVGCGEVANTHFRAWKTESSAEVVAVSDLNENLAKKAIEKWSIPRYYTSMTELLKSEKVDIVDLCTPPQTHAPLAIEVMESGVNVTIEKPMTMTPKDAEKIVECQKKTGVKAGVIHNWLFESPIVEAKSIVANGRLGDVYDVEVEAISTKEDLMAADKDHWCHKLPGGRFSEMLAHPIYLVRHFLGEFEVDNVFVSKIGDYPWMISDELVATFKVNNKFGRVYASFNAPRDAIYVDVYGSKGILKIDIINATVNLLPERKVSRFGKGADSLRQASQLVGSTVKNVSKVGSGRWLDGHGKYISQFAECVINDTEPPVTVEEGCRVVQTLDDMCKLILIQEKKSVRK